MVINGSEEDVKRQAEAMEERRRQTKLAKVHLYMALCSLVIVQFSHCHVAVLSFVAEVQPSLFVWWKDTEG